MLLLFVLLLLFIISEGAIVEEAAVASVAVDPRDDDFCFTPAVRKEWQERFPDAEVHAWPDVGHYVMEDAPDRLVEKLDDFLARHPLDLG